MSSFYLKKKKKKGSHCVLSEHFRHSQEQKFSFHVNSAKYLQITLETMNVSKSSAGDKSLGEK